MITESAPASDASNVNYAVVIDAGSSGSRAYIYHWLTHSGDPTTLLKIEPLKGEDDQPVVKAVTPGLSRFVGKKLVWLKTHHNMHLCLLVPIN